MILAVQSGVFKQENVLAERLHGLDQQMERKGDKSLYFMDRILVLLVGSVMDEAHVQGRLVCIGKKGRLAQDCRTVEILERIGLVAYRLRLSEELSRVHDTFHLSNLKRCLEDTNLHVPLNEIKVDKNFVCLEPVEIMIENLEVKHFKRVTCRYPWPELKGKRFGMILRAIEILENNLDNLSLTREEDDGISVALDPQTLISGFGVLTELEVVSLRCTIFLGVILVKGHELPTIVKSLPVGFHLSPTSVNTLPVGCDLQVLVEHFNPVEDNTGVLESDILDDSTCWMLLEDVRGSENLTFLTFFIGVIATFFSLSLIALGHVSLTYTSDS
ncbi:hypothetical protein Tco_0912653 [Tanacetum coccineum]